MKRWSWIVGFAALTCTGAAPVKKSAVYVPLCRSTSCNRAERLLLTESVIKAFDRDAPYRPAVSLEDADVVVNWSVSRGVEGIRRLNVEWRHRRTRKAIFLETDFEPGPAGDPASPEAIAGFVVAGMELVK